MFRSGPQRLSNWGSAFRTLELIFHVAVRNLRGKHGNAVWSLVSAVLQTFLMVVVLYFLFKLMGLNRVAVRGDFMLFVMSGVLMFMVHVKTIGAVAMADGPTSPMMMHAPMNPVISIMAAALSALYQQMLAALVVLFLYHALVTPVTIEDPIGVLGPFLLAWGSGIGIGMVFLSAKPWQPELISILTTLFMRINILASGKMVLANNVRPSLRAIFDWNPLFHVIDQGRGAIFLNYQPRYTSLEYPVYVTLGCVMIGLMAEFFTRQYASASWNKRR